MRWKEKRDKQRRKVKRTGQEASEDQEKEESRGTLKREVEKRNASRSNDR